MADVRRPGLLLDGDWEPFTQRIWFVESPYERVVAGVREWRDGLPGRTGYQELRGTLESLLGHLEPWAMPSWKELVVSARGGWTALFSQGSDVSTAAVMGRRLRCRTIRTNHAPHVRRGGRVVSYGDTALWLSDNRDPLGGDRSIQASNQGRWEWHLYGDQQPFEEPAVDRSRTGSTCRHSIGTAPPSASTGRTPPSTARRPRS